MAGNHHYNIKMQLKRSKNNARVYLRRTITEECLLFNRNYTMNVKWKLKLKSVLQTFWNFQLRKREYAIEKGDTNLNLSRIISNKIYGKLMINNIIDSSYYENKMMIINHRGT